MSGTKPCAECGKSFAWIQSTAKYCSQKCKRRAEYQQKRLDPVFQAKRAAARLSRRDGPMGLRRKVGPEEQAVIIEMREAGLSCPQIAKKILERFGWERSVKVIAAVSARCSDVVSSTRPSAEERIPDYRGVNDLFIAAMRAAPECPPEGIVKDTRPLCPQRFSRPSVYGGSVAASVAELGFSKGNRW